ncbi:MAG: hypothetical protein ACRDBY_04820 [Cetobacterium sp.]
MVKNQKPYLDRQSKIVFTPNSEGVYTPKYKNFDEETGNAKIIARNKIFLELVEFVNYARRYTDKRTGKKKSLPLFPYQWSCLLSVIDALLDPKSQQFLWAMSRQSGKTTNYEILIPFALVILPKYVETDSVRFTVILGSYKDDAVQEVFKKVRPFIYKAIEFYNKRNKDQLLCKYFDSKLKLKDNDDLLEIDKQFTNGETTTYSQIRAITCGAVSDGYSSNLSCMDESGLISADLFKTSMANFTSSTAGVTIYSGVPCENSASLFYDKKRDKMVKTFLYDYPLVRDMKYMVSKKLGDAYVADYMSKVSGNTGGEQSSFIRWNYYLDTEDSSGKFISKNTLINNNVLCNDIRRPNKSENIYVVAGVDVSASGDYKVMTIGETMIYKDFDIVTKKLVNKYRNDVCDMVSFNKLGQKQSGEDFAKNCAEMCKKYEVDCVAVDSSSAGGKIFTQLFRKHLAILGCKVMILPFSYNQNKQFLFGFLEQSIHNGDLHLLKEDSLWESEKLVEEMCYMLKKHVQGTTYVKYEAPKGNGFTDDHVNSLALFNLCIKEIYERSRDKNKCKVDDGSGNPWRLRLTRYTTLEDTPIEQAKKYLSKTLYDVPI